MKNNYKKLYKASKSNYGVLSPKTIWYHICYQPYFTPYIICTIPFILLKIMFYYSFITTKNVCFNIKYNYYYKNAKHFNIKIKPIALYLPQYHEIPENDKWWGKGFTEWTNVKKAMPLFEGHYQPHVPHSDIGYYDLSDVNVMRKQVEMAKKYGIYGFCFYYYHFKDGKRLLEMPINNWLQANDIDFPFCFSWANENWTRTWDGGDKEIIMPQDYNEENLVNMMQDMIPAFKDPRYIKIENKPLLLVYRAEIIPNVLDVVKKWRQVLKNNGFEDCYLVSMQNFEKKNPFSMGFDAATEFAPQCQKYYSLHLMEKTHLPENIFFQDFRQCVREMQYVNPNYPLFKCVCPSWDNSPRRGSNFPRIFLNASPELFKKFLMNAIKQTVMSFSQTHGYFFINAWNEWGEGAHLEPDQKYEYQYLEAVNQCLRKFND